MSKQYSATNYFSNVEELAQDIFNESKEEFFEQVRDFGSNIDLYDFFDEKVHEEVDREFIYMGLVECAYIIESSNNVEDDSGLWEGQEPKKAIETMAFFSLRNDVHAELKSVISDELDSKRSELEAIIDEIDTDRSIYSQDLQKAQERFEEIEEDEDSEDEAEELEGTIESLQQSLDGADETISEYEDFIFNIDQVLDIL